MGKCPFCGGEVSEDTLLYGGSCPKCFGEIPGEEAATDPGEQVKAQQAKSDNRRVLLRTMIPFVLAIPAIGMLFLMAIGFVIWNRNPTVETMVFDDVEEFDYAIVSAPDQPDPEPQQVATAPGPRNTAPRNVQKVDAMGVPVVEVKSSAGGIDFGGIGVTASRDGEALSDPTQIRNMLQQKMQAFGRQLKQCYDKRLKTRSDLEGRWKASFVVLETGYPDQVRFKGADMSDSEFEQCMVETVRKWKFSRISRPQPVEKNWRFRN